MEYNEVLNLRKSIRKYQEKPVDEALIRQMLEAAILAPSWKNSQVSRYYVAQSAEMREKVNACLAPFNQNNVLNAPVLIVSTIVMNRSGFEKDGTSTNELGNGWGYYDCGLHNMNLINKAAELGLGTLIMGIRDAQSLKEVLNIPETESVVAVISVGYPDIDPDRPRRKAVDDIAKFM
ncbi:MAG: nitroreductase family protein [Erysipelotrichaceae bacterium]|nr:nitroreductase family protein [Erysipelotrichaceae bacterium]